MTYNTKPNWGTVPVATTAIYGAGVWYSWDVTTAAQSIVKAQDLNLSFAIGLHNMDDKMAEEVLFASRDAASNGPQLVVTYTTKPASVPWYGWAIGGGLVVVAFLVGMFLTMRRSKRVKAES